MKKTSVILKTGGHCIQSSAKNELSRITVIILNSEEGSVPLEIMERYELLEEFLKYTDFSRLRASDERYSGIIPGICIIVRDENGRPVITAEADIPK